MGKALGVHHQLIGALNASNMTSKYLSTVVCDTMHERVNILFGLPCLSDTEMYVLAGNCVDVFTLGHYMNLPSLGYT